MEMNDNKPNSKMDALMKLKELAEQLMNEDFKSSKMPKLVAMKVSTVKPLDKQDESDRGSVELGQGEESCDNPLEDAMAETTETKHDSNESDLDKLRKLLGK